MEKIRTRIKRIVWGINRDQRGERGQQKKGQGVVRMWTDSKRKGLTK